MLSDRQIAKRLKISYDTFLRWRKDKPLLYTHIKEGFELKQLIINMDETMKQILNQTQHIKLKDSVYSEDDDNLYEVISFKANESDPFLVNKPYVWLRTKDKNVLNVLSYKDELVTSGITNNEALIDMNNYQVYDNEDKSHWIVSNNMKIEHIDEFFTWYKLKN
ncbi:MAG: hypothetical protein ACNI25_00140 [Halarcobacter sp.]